MGGSESTLAGLEGFQIVRVTNNSPAHVAGLVPFFDFITAVDKLHLDRDNPNFFFDYVRRNKDRAVTCQVFNLRVRGARDITLVPTDTWGGVGLLGCNVCWETADAALESTWHIVDVVPRSPAFKADLMAHRDYILGMQPAHDGGSITTFRDGSDFHSRVEEWRARMAVAPRNASRALLLMIFDSVDNAVKEVLVDMAGAHSLGIDVANGYLHVVPPTPNSDRLPMVKRFVVASGPTSGGGHSPIGEPASRPGLAAHGSTGSHGSVGDAAPMPDFPSPPRVGADETPARDPAPQAPAHHDATPAAQMTQQSHYGHSEQLSPTALAAAPASPAAVAAPPPTPAVPPQAAPEAPVPDASPFPAPHSAAAAPQQPTPQPPAQATPLKQPSPFPAPASASPFPAPRASGYAAPSFPMPPPRG